MNCLHTGEFGTRRMWLVVGLGLVLASSLSAGEPAVVRLRWPDADDASRANLQRLVGRDAGFQLVVIGVCEDGRELDLTRAVAYVAEPADRVQVDSQGWVSPAAEGDVTVRARYGSLEPLEMRFQVEGLLHDPEVNFANQVVPVFTKYGCNGGGCHGKSGGQNGFRLSLLGFEPTEDYQWLLKESRGRRLFPAAPDRSLLLVKATGGIPHGGGNRFAADSAPYRLLRRWIAQGMPFGHAKDPRVDGIEVRPGQRLMMPGESQQLSVWAHYTDGRLEDVTRTTQLEPNDGEMAEVDSRAHLTVRQRPGMVAVMARYQGHVDVFRATVPLGAATDKLPPSRGFVDDLVFNQWKRLGLPPSGLCDDATFLRRVTVDIAGRLPTLAEAQQFSDDAGPDKRARWIDQMLDSDSYADHFANKWSAILRNKRRGDDDKAATFAFHRWIRESFYENKPYDQFVREIVTASGDLGFAPAVAWYREVSDGSAMVEDTSQLFLGLRIQCARCHHHPFEKWSQQDYYGMAAFFSRVSRRQGPGQVEVLTTVGSAVATNPKTGQPVKPAGLDAPRLEVADEADPRQALADWLTQPDNPFFARSLVNRFWKHFMGRGIVDPEDDMRLTNPATNPELLDALAQDFVKSGFDLKHLLRTICDSSVYQLSSLPNEHNQGDKQSFSRYYPRRLSAETLLDAIDSVTGIATEFNGMPRGTRAMELPDAGFDSYFLTVFGRPEASSACECERSAEANLAQSLHLLNSNELHGKLTSDQGRVAQWAADQGRTASEKVAEMYLLCFSRSPEPDELQAATEYLQHVGTDRQRQGYEDIMWALINTKEFLFNH